MKFLTKPIGLYLHIPFCEKKCNYCDFYSSFVTEELLDEYTVALIREIKQWGGKINRPIDTIYFGGGTPSLLSHRLETVISAVKSAFSVTENSEITLEINPSGEVEELLKYAKQAGVNRLSIGAQSGTDSELKLLGRTHSAEDTVKTVELAKRFRFSNISLDIMLGLPSSSIKTLGKSLDFITGLNPQHISAYILKLEKNTAFYKKIDILNIPDDDSVAEQYLYMCEYLENKGYRHYEISNFCFGDNESRHNLKYWQGIDYLGIGPSAHSALDGKRFYYERDLKGFISGNKPLSDGECGSAEEYVMLSLRLESGINLNELENRFKINLNSEFFNRCKAFEKVELLKINDKKISLTNKGMLLSNSIITELLECIV
ncbi:MAG: radical SAM family heme chaperone HemW [Clostridia bacterium]|nr:radical SAM family heme chaperone HemW [Clostridia bacterium]